MATDRHSQPIHPVLTTKSVSFPVSSTRSEESRNSLALSCANDSPGESFFPTAANATAEIFEALSGTANPSKSRGNARPVSQLRGVFRKDGEERSAANRHSQRRNGAPSPSHSSHNHYNGTALKQTLDMILASDESVLLVAQKLYCIFDGDCSRLNDLQRLLESRWQIPARLFPLLFTNIRRVCASADDPSHISIENWTEAFKRWIQSVNARCSGSQLSRRYFVQRRHGRELSDTYLEGKKLGAGSFGDVYLMLHKTLGVARVVKQVQKTIVDISSEHIDGEIALLTSLDHPHIVRLYEAFETDDAISLVMDYAAGGDLSSVIAMEKNNQLTLEEFWVRCAVSQIAAAIEYMHSKGVIHCDLKPANSMLLQPYRRFERPHILLVDFGISEIFEERHSGSGDHTVIKGTPAYIAPEGFEMRISTKSDIWSLGIMVHELLLGRRPFKPARNVFMQYVEVRKTDPDLTELPELPRDLVTKLLAKDPKERPTATECREHPWLQHDPLDPPSSVALPNSAEPPKLTNITQKNFFERAAMLGIASCLGMQDVKELHDIFEALDTHQKGTLTLDELAEGLEKLELPYSPHDLMVMLDMDQSGDVSYTEFIAGLLSAERDLTERRVQHAFEMFDIDGNGSISMHELRLMLSGEGPLADVLPDGTTVEQIMEEVTGGEDMNITLDHFRAYLRRNIRLQKKKSSHDYRPTFASSEDKKSMIPPLTVENLVDHLGEEELGVSERSNCSIKSEAFPDIHKWLDVVFADAYSGAAFTWFHTFSDFKVEAAYVSHYMPQTLQQTILLCLALVVYSGWALCFEAWTWSPVIFRWNEPVLIAHNLGWLILLTSGLAMILVCARLKRKLSRRLVHDRYAVRFERGLCIWTCIIPWVSCYLANRFRVASLFYVDPLTVFKSLNSDYDLIFAIVGTQMFFAMRTHLRFVCCLCLAISCGLAYLTTSLIFGIADMRCVGNVFWAWPVLLLTVVSLLELSGQRVVEHHKRINFLSLYASHSVLKVAHEQDPRTHVDALISGRTPASRSARLKLALDLVKHFRDANDSVTKPMRKAFSCIFEIVQGVRDDVAQADRLLQVHIDDALSQNGVCGSARDALLAMFDSTPLVCTPCPMTESTSFNNISSEAWGWDVLSVSRPLLAVWHSLVLPIVTHAVATGKENKVSADRMVLTFYNCLMRGVKGKTVEARAALAVHATHWLALRMGLWAILAPWDRVALLVAAAGLHAADSGCITLEDPLLAHAVCFSKTLVALDESGLGNCVSDGTLRRLVKGLLTRARPRRMLEDARLVRIASEIDDNIVESEATRTALASVVLAAGDFAFLALPQSLHQAWVKLFAEEASIRVSIADLDVLGWLEGLIKVVVLPIYDTLDSVKGAHKFLSVPRGQLRANQLHLQSMGLNAVAKSPGLPITPAFLPGTATGQVQTSVPASLAGPRSLSRGESTPVMPSCTPAPTKEVHSRDVRGAGDVCRDSSHSSVQPPSSQSADSSEDERAGDCLVMQLPSAERERRNLTTPNSCAAYRINVRPLRWNDRTPPLANSRSAMKLEVRPAIVLSDAERPPLPQIPLPQEAAKLMMLQRWRRLSDSKRESTLRSLALTTELPGMVRAAAENHDERVLPE